MTNFSRRTLPSIAAWLCVAGAVAAAVERRAAVADAVTLTRAGEQEMTALVRQKVADGVPAIAVVVVSPREQLLLAAAGKRDVAAGAALAPDAIFRIASMTKPITSLAAMILVEEGRLGLDDQVAKYLPEYAQARVITAFNSADATVQTRPAARPITIRHLLTHTSGIAYSFVEARLARLEESGRKQSDVLLVHDPGDRFTYGPSTAVLGKVIEKASGRTLDQFMKTRIFDPLGMTDTGYVVPAEKRGRVVTSHAKNSSGFAERPNPGTISSGVAGDGGLFSTAADYGRFMQLFLNGGRAGTTRIVKETTIREMFSNQIGSLFVEQQPSTDLSLSQPFPFGGGKDKFGFGFQLQSAPGDAGLRSPGSGSWGGINNTHFWIDPRKQVAAAVLMQFRPYYDAAAIDVLRSVERLVYRRLSTS
jgi:CubicO group peptidase (beta-lactamase class C family)